MYYVYCDIHDTLNPFGQKNHINYQDRFEGDHNQ